MAACGGCSPCRRIRERSHPDVQWLLPESKLRVITIEQVRELMHTLELKPVEARWKIGVIVAADRMTTQAANAFLKTLEEPPARSLLILLSTEPGRLLETIVSRCLRLVFAEATTADDGQARWLVEFAEVAQGSGESLLARYRLLDVLLRELAQARREAEREVTGRSPLGRFPEVEPELRDRWEDEAAAATEAEYRRRREHALGAVHWWLRDVWLCAEGQPAELLALPGVEQATRAVAARLKADDAAANLQLVETTQRALRGTVQEAVALEVFLLKLRL